MKNSQQKYPAYKASGVDWLGEIPEHWEINRLGTRFLERRTKVSDKEYPPLSVTKQGILPQLDSAAKTNDGDNRKLVIAGDFVINSRSDRKGSSGISDRDGSVSLINIVIEPQDIDSGFCNYLLKGYSFIEEFYRMGHGIVADLWTTRYDEMKSIIIGFPPLSEQTAIAQFLDKKTTFIDKAIKIKEKQIELLKERRQILIQKAVTKGLNPDVKMKDSGIEWIGEIPEHWEVKALKYIARLQSGETITAEKFIEDGFPVFGGNGFRGYTSTFTNDGEFVLIGRQGALCGNVNYANGKFYASEHAIVVYPYSNENILWLGEVIKIADFNRLSQSAAQPGIAVSVIKNVIFPYPPAEEQNTISNFIKVISEKITIAISLKEREIYTIHEYKSTLINSAVTGKIKVLNKKIKNKN
ncbi:MAG: restriction endonuclease subunit S [Bacteroidetes bacterium]|nr:restriction endonuclease subunit S [Bacteroidota bacterium]